MIEKRPFGRTGHMSTRVIFGAYAVSPSDMAPDQLDRTLELLTCYGINHLDTAPSYGDSELHLGRWMPEYRERFFLATKTDKRTYGEAREQFRGSLERLRVDFVDLLQMHNLIDPQEWEVAMGPGGALEALIEAREQGLTRFVGVTGHGYSAPAMHLRSLERFDLDTVLLPCNYVMLQDSQYAADFETLLDLCQERGVAVQLIKSMACRPWKEQPETPIVWYEPLEAQADVDRAAWWLLGHEHVFLVSSGDVGVLAKILDAASRFQVSPSEKEMQEMAARLEMAPIFDK